MKEKFLTLEQNLCGARIFLNFIGLNLEPKEGLVNFYDKLNVYNNENIEVGKVYFENESVVINAITDFGELSATYPIGKISGFRDIETDGGVFTDWQHTIKYSLKNYKNFEGNLQMHISMDTTFGINFRVHSKINYIDKLGNNVTIKLMDDGDPFSYTAAKEGFKEELRISPWDDYEPYMCHTVSNGDFNKETRNFLNERVNFVWHNGDQDRSHLRVISAEAKNYETTKCEEVLVDRIMNNNTEEAVIQKAELIHEKDDTFAKKIGEIIDDFKTDNVSFMENLIEASFNKMSDKEKTALFGREIPKISYYNGSDNLIDAYFNFNNGNLFVSDKAYTKMMNIGKKQ